MLWTLPSALLLLAAALPLIVFLHSLKPRGVKLGTTTLFIWERVLRERPLRTRLGWLLRKNLLLILQLLAATALIAALADPSLIHFGSQSGDLVVVIDLSASMKAKGSKGMRFDAARREFVALVDGMSSGQKMLVIGAGAQPRLLVPFSADQRRLRELGRSLTATDAPGRVKEAILFAHAFVKRASADRVVVISDGAFSGAEEFAKSTAQVKFIKVDGGENNLAIVGFEVRRPLDHPANGEILVHVRNFTAKPMRVPLTLSVGAKVLRREIIDIGADGRRVLIYPLEQSWSGPLTAALEVDDDFATDNRAYLAVDDAPLLHLLYVGPGNPYLSNLLRFFAHVELTAAPAWDGEMARQNYDVIIFDRVAAPALTQGNFIFIDTLAANLPLQGRGKSDHPRLSAPLAKHPITEGLALGELRVRQALRVALTGSATVLAQSSDGPLMVAVERGRLRAVFIGFDLMESDLPLRVAFPVLLHNLLEWFQPARLEFPGQSAPAGTALALRLPASDDSVEITSPSGKKEILPAAARPLRFADTVESGFYSYKSASRTGRFAVNLLDESESNISPPANLTGAREANSAGSSTAESGFSLWPYLLALALLVLVGELLFAYRQGLALYPLLFRGAALAALVFAAVNPRIFKSTTALDVIFSVDLSRSVGQEGREKARDLLAAAQGWENPHTRTGLLAFGRAPEWEFLPRDKMILSDLGARMDREETDIQAALQAAAAQVGEGRQGRILLVSDGNENRGQTARVTDLLRSQGIAIWTLPVGLARGRNEVFLSDLTLPRQVDSAEGFEIRAVIESGREAPARIRLLRNGTLHSEQDVRLKAGSNRFSFRDSLTERGNHSYELLVESADDTLAENNLLQGVVEVKGPPRVLLLSSQPESQRVLARVLQVQGYAVVESAPQRHGLSLAELSAFDLLVLDNVPAFQLSYAKMETIEKYVRDLGGGLWVVGGSQSFGAGGYFRTPLERILPVDMRPPARLEMPHVALLFVIDKSGSMGAGAEGSTKLDLAKAAAMAAADIMNPSDQVGILAFDANWDWALPFRQVGKGEWLTSGLAGLQSDGGTDMYKAMVEAERAIAAMQASIKHVIVLSDGLTDKADFHSLVSKMANAGVTVSTVSVGNDADVQLMADIAKNGKGRGYVALDPQTIPQIFTTETLLISRDLLIEKPVTPTIVAASGPLKGIGQNNLPALRGYVLTYPKPRAELLMRADKDPLLVSWRYGLGRVMAFTSDLSGRWGKEWVGWQNFSQWTSQIARDTMRKILDAKLRADFLADGDAVKIVADLAARDGSFLNHLKLKANISAPDRGTSAQSLQQSAPGRYEGKFNSGQRGIHFATLYAEAEGGAAPLAVATLPYIAPYPKEYRELKPNLALLSRLAEETGGEMLDGENFAAGLQRLYTPTPGKGSQGKDTWWPLAGAGLLLFLADLVLRSWPVRRRAVV
ncbi:MAG: VWA domain-containing protein [Deltaproteobacteria bacterium]|nr:VWA domain-containing protein [Deltaproteobacteria bacterium]